MGGGNWTTTAYNCAINEMGFSSKTDIVTASTQKFFKKKGLADELNPKGVIRECRDTAEHPNTIPVILALDVTGSMGSAAKACAAKLDDIMEKLYGSVKDVEFLMMGLGDLAYDSAPIQASQFESDIRILDQTSKIWFEAGGGPNAFESYSAAWYFGLNHTDLDCWKRGRKGIIITLGDEPLNPYLPATNLEKILCAQAVDSNAEIETKPLYKKASEKFDIFHIAITDRETNFESWKPKVRDSWKELLGQNYMEGRSDELDELISGIIKTCSAGYSMENVVTVDENGIKW